MNGISSNLKEELKKSNNQKHKEKIKFITTILLTNAMVALLCLPSAREVSTATNKGSLILHPHYKMLVLPLTPLMNYSVAEKEVPVTLISRDKKIIIKKAFLHEAEKDKLSEGNIRHFKIEINESDLIQSQAMLETEMIAVPYVETKISRTNKKKGSTYETTL